MTSSNRRVWLTTTWVVSSAAALVAVVLTATAILQSHKVSDELPDVPDQPQATPTAEELRFAECVVALLPPWFKQLEARGERALIDHHRWRPQRETRLTAERHCTLQQGHDYSGSLAALYAAMKRDAVYQSASAFEQILSERANAEEMRSEVDLVVYKRRHRQTLFLHALASAPERPDGDVERKGTSARRASGDRPCSVVAGKPVRYWTGKVVEATYNDGRLNAVRVEIAPNVVLAQSFDDRARHYQRRPDVDTTEPLGIGQPVGIDGMFPKGRGACPSGPREGAPDPVGAQVLDFEFARIRPLELFVDDSASGWALSTILRARWRWLPPDDRPPGYSFREFHEELLANGWRHVGHRHLVDDTRLAYEHDGQWIAFEAFTRDPPGKHPDKWSLQDPDVIKLLRQLKGEPAPEPTPPNRKQSAVRAARALFDLTCPDSSDQS